MIAETARRQFAAGFVQGWREAGERSGRFLFFCYLAAGIGSAIAAALALR
jgi:hypothetical protein